MNICISNYEHILPQEFKYDEKQNDLYDSATNQLNDNDVIEKYVLYKNEDAFSIIVKRYENMVYGIAYRMLKSHNLAEEVLQEVFLILSSKLDTFRQESMFSTWLYRITLNVCYAYMNNEYKHSNNVSLDNNLDSDISSDFKQQLKDTRSYGPQEETSQTEILDIIEKEIADLPYKYRVVCMLRDIEGLTNPEVSKILNISVPAVKSRILRARNILKKSLKNKLDM